MEPGQFNMAYDTSTSKINVHKKQIVKLEAKMELQVSTNLLI